MTKHFSVLALILIGCGGAIEDHGVATSDYASETTTEVDSTNTVVDSTTSDDSTSDVAPTTTLPTTSASTVTSRPIPSTTTDVTTTDVTTTDVTSNGTNVPSETTDATTTDEETTSDASSTSDDVVTIDEETTSDDVTSTDGETTTEETTGVTTTDEETSTSDHVTTTDEETTSTEAETTSDEETTTEEPVLVCIPNAACADDGNPCTNDICSADGLTCNHPAKTNGTACGSALNSLCDNADSCQAGVCAPNYKPAGTSCDTDTNICTQDVCNGAGACNVTAAPANTVCDTASCDDDILIGAATCGGQTSCPLEREITECYGACNVQGNACEIPGIEEVHTTASSIQQLSSNTADLFFLENGGIRKMSKTTQTVSSISYTKDADMAHLFIYPSDAYMVTVEMNAEGSSQRVFCSALTGGSKTLARTLNVGEVVVIADGAINWIVATQSNGVFNSDLLRLDCAGHSNVTSMYYTPNNRVIMGKPVVTSSSIYFVVRSANSTTYEQKVVMVSKTNGTELGHAIDLEWAPTSWGVENGEVVYINGKVWYRSPAHIFSFPADVDLDEGILTEELNTEGLDLSFRNNQWHGNFVYGMHFQRTNITTGEVDVWTEFEFLRGLVFSGNTAYFHSNCWEASETCNEAIYSMSM